MQSLWLPSAVCAGCRRTGGPLRPSRKAVGGAQLAAEHCPRDRRLAHDGGQASKKAQQASPPLPRRQPNKAQRKQWEALKLDEMWRFVGRRRGKVWSWLAVERGSRRVMAWVLGQRNAATARRLWAALSRRYCRHCWYFTDLFPAYAQALPAGPHRPCLKAEGQTNIVEALNCPLRQRCGVLVRKSCFFSKSLVMHAARIKICIDQHNRSIILS